MTAGLDWDEHTFSYSNPLDDIVRFYISRDPIGFVLSRRVSDVPGKVFNYCGGCTNLLGDIIYRSSGMKADEFARQFLFGPLGIESAERVHLRNETVYMSGDIRLLPRDLLKPGLMLQNGGTWEGSRIVSEQWIEESTTIHVPFDENGKCGYGYQWWIESVPFANFSARGWGDQLLVVLPELELVAVITGGNYRRDRGIDRLFADYLVPLVVPEIPDRNQADSQL
jgi:CubicO group peptidase (beta-lactamase class C family)